MKKLGILLSGRGSNFEAIADNVASGKLDATIAVVISNRADASGIESARRRGFLPFLGMMVLVGFTELIAIGVGLVRLKGLLAGGTPPPPIALTESRGQTRMMGALPAHRFQPTAPPHKMGELVAPQHLLGKMRRE